VPFLLRLVEFIISDEYDGFYKALSGEYDGFYKVLSGGCANKIKVSSFCRTQSSVDRSMQQSSSMAASKGDCPALFCCVFLCH